MTTALTVVKVVGYTAVAVAGAYLAYQVGYYVYYKASGASLPGKTPVAPTADPGAQTTTSHGTPTPAPAPSASSPAATTPEGRPAADIPATSQIGN